MQKPLIDFMRALRGVNIDVASPEIADALRTTELIGLEDKGRLKLALGIVIARDEDELNAFNQCFDDFFQFRHLDDSTEHENQLDDIEMQHIEAANDNRKRPQLTEVNSQGDQAPAQSNSIGQRQAQSQLAQMLMENDQAGLAMGMSRAAQAVGLANIRVMTQKGLYGRKMMMEMGLRELEEEMFALQDSNLADDQALAMRLRQARDELRRAIREFVEQQFALYATEHTNELRESVMEKVHFQHLHEFRDVKKLVRRMAKKLAARHSRRRKVTRRGQLDVRRTLQKNMAYNGILFEPQWKARRVDKPKVMAICDVSGSVATVSRFLLMFLYSLSEVLTDVRAFAFSGKLAEVTDLFEQHDLDKAVNMTLQQYGMGSTDYGQALEDFAALALDDIDNKTTVIMLGDARNNFGDDKAEIFKLISRRAKQVIWLNPEPRSRWNSGDAIMKKYLPACHLAEQCSSLKDLNRAVDKMLRTLK